MNIHGNALLSKTGTCGSSWLEPFVVVSVDYEPKTQHSIFSILEVFMLINLFGLSTEIEPPLRFLSKFTYRLFIFKERKSYAVTLFSA